MNESGMGHVAESLWKAERALGLDSVLLNCGESSQFHNADDADVHVIHTHAPDHVLHMGKPLVWVGHGTPDVMWHSGYEQGTVNGSYGHGDAWMMAQYWLQHCDVTVTFWERHAQIWKSLCDKHTRVECLQLGIDLDEWKPAESQGKYAGTPSVFTAENCYEMKWPLDLFIAWPWVVSDPELYAARLHAVYVPKDQHRWWFPLVNRNGCSFRSFISPIVFSREHLRNTFASTDFYCGLVRHGDFNRLSLEAAACGAKVISYWGNPYATYWVDEGDQRRLAVQLKAILKGEVEPRTPYPVADVSETAKAMKEIYESL